MEMMMKNPKFQIYFGADDQFYFNLKAANGEVILGSEGYTAKSSCQNGIASVKTNAQLDQRFLRKIASNGQFYFTLTAANNEPIGISEMYSTESAREKGIEAVKKTAPDASVEDIT